MQLKQKKIVYNSVHEPCMYRKKFRIETMELKRWFVETGIKAVNWHAKLSFTSAVRLSTRHRTRPLHSTHTIHIRNVDRVLVQWYTLHAYGMYTYYTSYLDTNYIKRFTRSNVRSVHVWKPFCGLNRHGRTSNFERTCIAHWWWIYSLMKSKIR